MFVPVPLPHLIYMKNPYRIHYCYLCFVRPTYSITYALEENSLSVLIKGLYVINMRRLVENDFGIRW